MINPIRLLENATYYIRWDRFDGTATTSRTIPLETDELEALEILFQSIRQLKSSQAVIR